MPALDALRFRFARLRGLLRRGLASLRSRGVRATWERLRIQLAPVQHAEATPLLTMEPGDITSLAFAPATAPEVSIVIPVYGQLEKTLACLRMLMTHPASTSHDIIVVDDASPDGSGAQLAQIPGLRVIQRATNGGFIAACNEGASVARGEFLVFLNNDTWPQPGWLYALRHTFHHEPDAGLVTAQLVYPDGRLQESGGVVFADGGGWSYGRFEGRADPRFGFLREADYGSGAALMVPAALFRELGGFDTRYAPAYYEDVDLAFEVRDAGRKVFVQPAAVVVHDEGGTAGTDTAQGTKAAQLLNQPIFAAKWSKELNSRPMQGSTPNARSVHGKKPHVLVIDAATPRPDHDSASLRLVNLMQLLREEGAHVAFLPDDGAHAGHYTRVLQRHGIEAWYAPYLQAPADWLREHGSRFDTVIVSRHYIAQAWIPLLRRFAPQARIVFDSVDLHYLREARGAEVTNDTAALRAAEQTRERELAVISSADVTWVVSEAERAQLLRDAPDTNVSVVSNLHRIADEGLPFAQRHDLVFVGGFRHPPNVDGVLWFGHEVFPRVRAALPEVQWHVVGQAPPAEVQALAAQPGIVVHGHVPDIEPLMRGARIAIAPLRFGAGVKGKVNLSMAHGQPVVATSCAVEGMHLEDGVDVRVADDAVRFADAIIALYQDEMQWTTLVRNGRDNIAQHFSMDAARATVRSVLPAR